METKNGTPTRASRQDIIEVALQLMSERPAERVSARAIAEAAGCDPAMITYHFGGRSGLVAEVARRATQMLTNQIDLDFDVTSGLEAAMRAMIVNPALVMRREPQLVQLYIAEALLSGNPASENMIRDLALGYFAHVQEVFEHPFPDTEVRPECRGILFYALIVVPLFPYFLLPWQRRRSKVNAGPLGNIELLTDTMTDLVLRGAATLESPFGDSGPLAAPFSTINDEALVNAGTTVLRRGLEFSYASLAEVLGENETLIRTRVPDLATLALSVARASIELAPTPRVARHAELTAQEPRRRGRPAAANPEVEASLRAAAMRLVDRNRRHVTARSVAAEVGCDPALVTYYFGGRHGLIQAVAEQAIEEFVALFTRSYRPDDPPAQRLVNALTPALTSVAAKPGLCQAIIDEFIIRGTTSSDTSFATLTAPYFTRLREVVKEGLLQGEFREVDAGSLMYFVGVMPIMLASIVPLLKQVQGGPDIPESPAELVSAIEQLVFRGAIVARDAFG